MAFKKKHSTYGSPKETGEIHGGSSMGSRHEMPEVGPGRAAMRTNTRSAEAIPGAAASGATPKGMHISRQGE